MDKHTEDTFQDFLERAEKAEVSDLRLRIVRSPEGLLDFYIHPINKDGETGDFGVNGGFVCPLRDRNGHKLCAGSSRPVIELLGS